MLKKINKKYITKGMFIQELCGSWMDHPFWKSSFLLQKDEDLNKILSSDVLDVWIDTSKGLDVDSEIKSENTEQINKKVDSILQNLSVKTFSDVKIIKPTSYKQELQQAKEIQKQSNKAVKQMLNDVRMGKALPLDEVDNVVDDITESIVRNSNALLNLVRLKNANEYTYMHSVAVCALMIALAKTMKLPEKEYKTIGMAGLLHDLGKIMIDDAVLNKPGKLTDEEFLLIKSHPQKGYNIIKDSKEISDIAKDVCLHHHEKIDGTGYPNKLSDKEISTYAKMGAVCDVYDALTSNRSYKEGWHPNEAIRKMAEWKGGHFDDEIFGYFVKTVGIYPPGTIVNLNSGKVGIVISNNESLLQPNIKVFYSKKTNSYITPYDLNMSKTDEKIINSDQNNKYKINIADFLYSDQ